jgi:DNA-binding transcriptional LysR family regulator
MDLFRAMRTFVTTVQTGSMNAAALQLAISPALVGQHVAALENRLGTRLLNRTTRRQSLTDFGLGYYEQCLDILHRVALSDDEADAQQAVPRGRLRITAPSSFGAEVLMPALRSYRESAPEVDLDITLTDRNVDLVEEGVDVAFRIGALADSAVIARPLAPYRMMICAAPSYLQRVGRPSHPKDLEQHESIGFTPATQSAWRLSKGEEIVEVSPIRHVTVNSGQAVRMAACAGLGVILQPAILLAADIRNRTLEQLFPDWQLAERPMSLLYYRDRHMTPRLRSFISFAVKTFGFNDHGADGAGVGIRED